VPTATLDSPELVPRYQSHLVYESANFEKVQHSKEGCFFLSVMHQLAQQLGDLEWLPAEVASTILPDTINLTSYSRIE
jgi:hypothetical protein